MFLYGASGHAKVIIDILKANNLKIDALYDDNASIKELLKIPVFSTDNIRGPLIISIGNNAIRKLLSEKINVEYAKIAHPSAIISSNASFAEGTVVMQNAVIQSDTYIGRHCIINTSASVDHDCVIGDFVHISPNATLCGGVTIGEGTWIGAGAIIIHGVRIGKWSIVGAGSVVTKDLPDQVLAVGNRCKIVKNI